MNDDTRRRRRKRGPSDHRSRRSRDSYYDDEDELDDDFDEEDDDEEYEERPRPRRRAVGGRDARRRRRPSREKRGRGLFGGRKEAAPRRGSRSGPDWAAAEDDGYEDEGPYVDDEDSGDWEPRRRKRGRDRPSRRQGPRRRKTLIALCTPVFGHAAMLPREEGGIGPSYEQFRQEILRSLDRIQEEAGEHGIETEDAREAVYALCLFLDEQVAGSTWIGREQWAAEPLGMSLIHDPEGGVNFFDHLDALGGRQKDVKKVFLVCLSMGFRGKYADLMDEVREASRLAEIQRTIIRSIHPTPLDKREYLFPEGYTPAEAIDDEAPAAPRSWVGLSLGVVFIAFLLYLLLFWQAGRIPSAAEQAVEGQLSGSAEGAEDSR